MMIRLIIPVLILLGCGSLRAADLPVDTTLVEVTGYLYTGEGSRSVPVPFATVTIVRNGRGSFSNFSGIFSIVAHEGETLRITAMGFKTVEYFIPRGIEGTRHSILLRLEQEPIVLPEAVVFPWPSRENMRIEFLNMDPNEALALEDLAEKNLAEREMRRVAKAMIPDGNESADFYLRQQASNLYTFGGQQGAMPVFSPLAWAQFFQSIKANKEKKKKNKDDDD